MSNRSYEFDSSKAVNDELEDLNRELELIELLLKKHSLKPLDDIEVRAAALCPELLKSFERRIQEIGR